MCLFSACSANKSEFMRDCERNYSMWTFSGGFRTWVKMSLLTTSGVKNEAVEFRQEVFMSQQFTCSSMHDDI